MSQCPDGGKGMMSGGRGPRHVRHESQTQSDRSSIDPPAGSDRTLSSPAPVTRTQIELPVATILKVLVTIALLLILSQVWQILLLVFIGLFVAMVLARPVSWLQDRGLPRGIAITLVLGAVIGVVVLVLWYGTPGLVTELREFWIQLPDYVEIALALTASRWPDFYEQAVAWAQEQQSGLNAGGFDVRGVLSQGLDLITGVFNVVLTLIIAVYILADEGRSLEGVYQWMPPHHASKLRRTFPAVTNVVNGYVVGQGINSTLFALFALILLSTLNVPSAAVLALIAAIGDAIPQIGVILATIPAVLLALTQSLETALIVLVAYFIYQQIENYVTSPRVFSRTLQLRPLVTLLAVLIGGKLLGIIGVLIALPVAAAIPTVAAIWLEDDAKAA
jgi:predicted PurR-regulated permease PerM